MLLEALANKLVTASVGTLATNLFLGHMPENPDSCLALFEYSGPEPLETMQTMTTTVEMPSIQVMARATTYPAARTLIINARDVLTGITNETVSGVRFLRVSSTGAVNSIGRDATERNMFTLTLQTMVER